MAKKLELTPRLQAVASFVPEGARFADIGTDHAYLPAALILDGKIPFAIAADLRQGPLSRAKMTVRDYGLNGQVAFRLCDGLKGIRPDEVDAIAIAGMGGETIAMILEAAPWTRERDIPLILQPMSSMTDLRGWLADHGYCIQEEKLVREGETLYVVLSVRAGTMEPLTPAQLYAGRNSDDPLRGEWLDHWLGKTNRALDGLGQSRQEGVAARIGELEQVRDGLLAMKKEWEAWQM